MLFSTDMAKAKVDCIYQQPLKMAGLIRKGWKRQDSCSSSSSSSSVEDGSRYPVPAMFCDAICAGRVKHLLFQPYLDLNARLLRRGNHF